MHQVKVPSSQNALLLLDLCRGLQLSYVDVNAACSFAVQGETVILLEISQK